MSDRNESYGNPSANYLMQRVWDAEHPPKGGMRTGDPRITVPTCPVVHVCESLRAAIMKRDSLRDRIVNAPRLNITDMGPSSPGGRWIIRPSDVPISVRGKVVALVVLEDE